MSATAYDPIRAEDCRFAVLAQLARRHHTAHSADTLCTVHLRGEYDLAEVQGALNLMATSQPPLVLRIPNPPPSTSSSWQITLEGLASHENRR